MCSLNGRNVVIFIDTIVNKEDTEKSCADC